MREELKSWLNSFYYLIISIKDIFVDIGSVLLSILKTLWYWLTSITSSLRSVFNDVIDNGAILWLYNTLNDIASLIGGPTFVIIASMFLIIITRILIAFVFKLFRLNIDYHALNEKNTKYNLKDSASRKTLFD